MKQNRVGLAFAAMVFVMSCASAPPDVHAPFDAFINQTISESAIPGVAIVVLRDGETVHSAGYGYADVERGRAMTADTPMNLASISKPVLGMGLLRLREEGRLDLDAEVNDFLDFEVDIPIIEFERITVRTLAAHTSGIADFLDETTYVPNADPPTPVGDFVRQLLVPGGARYNDGAFYLNASPGAAREYSNLGAGVAGAVLESVAGESLASYQARTLFRPLGMRHSSWRIADYGPNELAVRYNASTTPLPHYGNPNYADGAFNASASDLAILMRFAFSDGALGRRRVLSSESMAEMFRLQAEGADARQRFFWRDRDGLTGHLGSDAGVFTAFFFDRANRNGFIVLMNRTPDRGSEQAMVQIVGRIRSDFFAQSPASQVSYMCLIALARQGHI